MADIVSAVTGTLDIVVLTLTAIIILFMIGVIIWFIWFTRQFKHKIVLRKKTKGDTDLVISTTYRYVTPKGEPEKIQLWYKKKYKPVPPEEAKDFTAKGSEFCEGWLRDTGEIDYIEATDKNDILDDETALNIISTDDKEFYANAHFEATRLKRKNFLTLLTENIGVIALVLIFIITLAFWEEITAPMIAVSNTNAIISEQNSEVLARLETILKDRQYPQAENITTIAPD